MGGGSLHLTVAVLYGISNANADGEKFARNETLLAAALTRLAAARDEPYVLATDANVSFTRSKVLQTCVGARICYDELEERTTEGTTPAPTSSCTVSRSR